jgi:hypothetical protein
MAPLFLCTNKNQLKGLYAAAERSFIGVSLAIPLLLSVLVVGFELLAPEVVGQ